MSGGYPGQGQHSQYSQYYQGQQQQQQQQPPYPQQQQAHYPYVLARGAVEREPVRFC